MFDLHGRTALVTGGDSGIGRAMFQAVQCTMCHRFGPGITSNTGLRISMGAVSSSAPLISNVAQWDRRAATGSKRWLHIKSTLAK